METRTVLVVDDDPGFRDNLKDILEEHGYRILCAGTCREAMQLAEEFRPMAALLDIRLPDESGLKLTKRIKAKYPAINVVMLTSHNLPEYRQAATECGASHFFVKGTSNGNEIKSLVESLLKG